jgi:pimeloyl-ACP methyl ester carboxylesterase/DNA-binding winged helix-turn-helix (wHTH) protein
MVEAPPRLDTPMIFTFTDCALDTNRCELRRSGEVRHVEPQVFDLLVHLLENRDRLVTREELLDAIWGHRYVTPSTLSSRLKALRQAVGDDGKAQSIVRTVRGRGFRFVADVAMQSHDGSNGTEASASPRVDPAASGEPPMGPVPDASGARSQQQIRFCRAHDGVRIAFGTCGSGPPLVKTANWLSHLEYDWVSPVWRHWIRELSRDHTLVRYDERGCGLSDWHAADLSLDAWVRDLESVVDTLGLERFPLLGVSQGGAVAVAYAARHPERVSRLILYGSFARGRGRRDDPAESERLAVLQRMLPLGWGRDNPAFREFFARLFLPEGTPEQIAWFADLQRQSATPENGSRLFAEFCDADVSGLAREVRVPTLVLHLSADAVVPFQAGRTLASLIPGATFVPIWGRNHLILEHEPAWGRFIGEVRTFLGQGEPQSDSLASSRV